MDDQLYQRVLTRLYDDETLDEAVVDLVDAACRSDEALERALAGQPDPRPAVAHVLEEAAAVAPSPAYLRSITAAGFRGVGKERSLPLHPGPGLTLVVGRNGSGKSSFAEAAEVALTGDNARWQKRTADWRKGWKNLHAHGAVRAQVQLTVEGVAQPVSVTRRWDGDDFSASTVKVSPADAKADWASALATYRPFLSYSELGGLLEAGPTTLYKAIAPLLGLGELSDARERVRQRRLAGQKEGKAVKQRAAELAETAAGLDDPRAATLSKELGRRTHKLDVLEGLVVGEEGDDTSSAVKRLAAVLRQEAPAEERVLGSAEKLRALAARVDDLTQKDTARSLELATLLDQALVLVDAQTTTCPLCGTVEAFDAHWTEHARERSQQLREQAGALAQAREDLAKLEQGVARALPKLSVPVFEAAPLQATAALLAANQTWIDGATLRGTALADHLLEAWTPLAEALASLKLEAQAEHDRLQNLWRPLALDVADWLKRAASFDATAERLAQLKTAEAWLGELEGALRADRFAPIAEKVKKAWRVLRSRSNVDISGVEMIGKGTHKKVDVQVQVDGHDGVALGVMSQGELHALALSLFLPRVTLPESPFGFLLVDDPVQSMDPARVDGLARLLSSTARSRQVIVFTHDERLPEALRRLQLPARVLHVTRKEQSVVEVHEADDPIRQHLEDAFAVATQEQKIGHTVASRVVPGLCRLALEAAVTSAIRRRRLGQGEVHADVERAIADAEGLKPVTALAFFDDASRVNEVVGRLRKTYGQQAVDAFELCNDGSHHGYTGDMVSLVRLCRSVAQGLERL